MHEKKFSAMLSSPTTDRSRALLIIGACLVCAGAASSPRVTPDSTAAACWQPYYCPQNFIDDCGENVVCCQVDPWGQHETFVENMQTAFGQMGEGTYSGHHCFEGRVGAMDSIYLNAAFFVYDWGTCDYGGGVHMWNSENILVDAFQSFSWYVPTFWHEGYSVFNDCEAYENCHIYDIMYPMYGYCAAQ